MFTCAKIRKGTTYLDSHLRANDYYSENERVTGLWMGQGAAILGLEGKHIGKNDAAFEAIRQNLRPGSFGKLTSQTAENGVRLFDFQCSAQKSVSIMAVTLGDRRLLEAHDKATALAFGELERFAAFRSGKTRKAAISGNLCAAAFRHDASRALDPQIHTHFVVANATWDSNKQRWMALDTSEMFKAIRYAGKVYQNELALECRKLGYEVESSRNEKGVVEGFQIKGVPAEILERFSKRRSEVEAGIERFRVDKGREPSPAETAVIARETRNVKLHEITTAEVRARQLEQLSPEEQFSLRELKRAALESSQKPISMGSAWKSMIAARDHIYERESVVSGHKIMAEALNHQLGFISLDTLRRYMQNAYNGMIRLTRHISNPLLSTQWTSRRALMLERQAIAFVNQTQDSCSPLGKTEGVSFDFKSGEQRTVVLETLNNRDRVYSIRGCAGAGKTTCLSEIHKGLEAAGRTTLYLAPTSSAVEVLRKDGFTATTVDDFLTNRPKNLRDDSVIIIDESSLQSSAMGASVLQAARNARILFVGDTRQHTSVEAGDFLRVLEQHSQLRHSELRDIRRQQVKEYNDAIRAMSRGDAAGGMKQLDELGWMHESSGPYIRQAADAYLAAISYGAELDHCIAIAPTWAENHRFTDAIRRGLKQRGRLGEGSTVTVCHQLDWTEAQKKAADNYRPGMLVTFSSRVDNIPRGKTLEVSCAASGMLWLKGCDKPLKTEQAADKLTVSLPRNIEISIGDKILIRRNHRETGLINGEVLTVKNIAADGSIETAEGKRIDAGFRHFCHGYVVTSYKSQGRTHEQTIIAAERLDAKSAYVACSRGRQSAQIFTPDKEQLFKRLGKSSDRTAASDITARSEFWQMEESAAYRGAVKDQILFNVIHNSRTSGFEPFIDL